jgi:hypothetical protein
MSDLNRKLPASAAPVEPSESSDHLPQVPGFRTWRGIYIFVLAFFVAVVVLLTLFSRHFA